MASYSALRRSDNGDNKKRASYSALRRSANEDNRKINQGKRISYSALRRSVSEDNKQKGLIQRSKALGQWRQQKRASSSALRRSANGDTGPRELRVDLLRGNGRPGSVGMGRKSCASNFRRKDTTPGRHRNQRLLEDLGVSRVDFGDLQVSDAESHNPGSVDRFLKCSKLQQKPSVHQ